MIPASSFLLDGDTALVVIGSLVWVDHDLIWEELNRPCDTCGGPGVRMVEAYTTTIPEDVDCPDCDGIGRHTFMVDVERKVHVGAGWRNEPRTLRVHVIDVLPIYGRPDTPLPAGTDRWVWHSPWDLDPDRRGTFLWEIVGNETVMTRITLPPDASPGKWLVRLAVHQNVETST